MPLVLGSEIVPVTGRPETRCVSGLATNTFTVKFVDPGVTCPRTATTFP